MRRLTKFAVVATLIGVPALAPTSASAAPAGSVVRYQTTTTSYHVTVFGTYIHDFTVTTNPCDGTTTTTGTTPTDSGYYTTETAAFTTSGGTVSFHAVYDGPYSPGFVFDGGFPVGGGDLTGPFAGAGSTVTQTDSTTSYANHGQYVAANGGGDDAAHSCIGKPVQSQS